MGVCKWENTVSYFYLFIDTLVYNIIFFIDTLVYNIIFFIDTLVYNIIFFIDTPVCNFYNFRDIKKNIYNVFKLYNEVKHNDNILISMSHLPSTTPSIYHNFIFLLIFYFNSDISSSFMSLSINKNCSGSFVIRLSFDIYFSIQRAFLHNIFESIIYFIILYEAIFSLLYRYICSEYCETKINYNKLSNITI